MFTLRSISHFINTEPNSPTSSDPCQVSSLGSDPSFRSAHRSGIRFTPTQGMVLWCDYSGYRVGEIGDKTRPVIVISPWHLNRHTVYVAPVTHSTWHATLLDVCLPADRYSFFTAGRDQWVKSQLVAHVEHSRLDRMRLHGCWSAPRISTADLQKILASISSIFSLPPLSATPTSFEEASA